MNKNIIKAKSKAGGLRPGAGRPAGSGKFKEQTKPIRIPKSLLPQIQQLLDKNSNLSLHSNQQISKEHQVERQGLRNPPHLWGDEHTILNNKFLPLPLYSTRVAAGFPSPAEDHIDLELDLNEHLVKRPAATFFVRVSGVSMIGAGIHENDILIVDRSIKPTNGKVVIAVINGELTVKRIKISKNKILLMPENEKYSPIVINEEMDFSIWGVVTNVIHPL